MRSTRDVERTVREWSRKSGLVKAAAAHADRCLLELHYGDPERAVAAIRQAVHTLRESLWWRAHMPSATHRRRAA